mmetsp:Transcript_6096/g.11128  ORF Transcript_6096/g.11128 Transcript_6096/m.11128 type:complete len:84 (-) Transcript_6096:1054-1305(-)
MSIKRKGNKQNPADSRHVRRNEKLDEARRFLANWFPPKIPTMKISMGKANSTREDMLESKRSGIDPGKKVSKEEEESVLPVTS